MKSPGLHCFLFLQFPFLLLCQNNRGLPFFYNYPPKLYKSASTTWDINQTPDGRLYFGNSEGLLEYNGQEWKIYKVANQSTVRSIATDSNGVIYVGAKSEFGFFKRTKTDSLQYHSLIPHIKDSTIHFADVWNTYVTPHGVFYLTFEKIFRYHHHTLQSYHIPRLSAHLGYFLNNELFVITRSHGLLKYEAGQDTFINTPGGTFWAHKSIFSMLPFKENKILVVSRYHETDSFYVYDPVRGDITPLLLDKAAHSLPVSKIYYGVKTPSQQYIFATLLDGIYVFDANFHLQYHLSQQTGLIDNNIKCLFIDQMGSLWAGTSNGICRIDLNIPLTFFDKDCGFAGSVRSIINYQNTLYIATETGVYFLDTTESNWEMKFKKVNNFSEQSWAFFSMENFLLIATSNGIFKMQNNRITPVKVSPKEAIFSISPSRKSPYHTYIATKTGIALINWQNPLQPRFEFYLKDLMTECHHVTESASGDLWVETPYDYVLYIKNPLDPDISSSSYRKIYTGKISYSDGLFTFRNHLYLSTDSGVLQFSHDQWKKHTPSLVHTPDSSFRWQNIYTFRHYYWIHYHWNGFYGMAPCNIKNNTLYPLLFPYNRIHEKLYHPSSAYYDSTFHILWIISPEGIVGCQPDFTFNPGNFSCLISKIHINGFPYYTGRGILPSDSIEMEYINNAIRFEYTATSFILPEQNMFQYLLEGYTNQWSDWTKERVKEYTNLPPGHYVFKVRCKNIYHQLSKEISVPFTVLTPWYRTGWAYAMYVSLFLVILGGVSKLASYRSEKARQKLEKIVEERTREIQEEKNKVEKHQQALSIMHKKLAEKNKDLIDSIKYARKIQRAVLPDKEKLEDLKEQSFIYYRPRDIVSGDFYWFKKINDIYIIAIADCTGHGVPGAFMSLIGTTLLDHIIQDPTMLPPAESLSLLNQQLREAVSMGHEETADGMDIALITYHATHHLIQFAGANQNLYRISEHQLYEYNGDKHSIGGKYENNKHFHGIDISVKSGDMIYLFTDGYADQFGGPKNKKFKKSQLKELLLQIHSMELTEQKRILHESFLQWKGKNTQTDDILIFGLRIA